MSTVLALTTAFFVFCSAVAVAKDTAPDQTEMPASTGANQPIGGGKPVTTTTIKRCPEGYELIVRVNGQRGCAKDIVPANE